MSAQRPKPAQDSVPFRVRRHLRFGWWTLLLFLSLGMALEILHGFKAQSYLGVGNESRRLMWRLAHAHGGFLALLHLAFAFTLSSPHWPARCRDLISGCLTAASILMPSGFFLAGVFLADGRPGFWIALVPMGGLLLVVATGLLQGRGDSHRA